MPKEKTANTISKEELEKASEALAAFQKEEAELEAKVAEEAKREEETVVVSGKKKKQGKAKRRGEKYSEARKKLDKTKEYSVEEAVKELRKAKFAGFTESVELHVRMGIDPKNTDHRIRFTTSLPFGTGKSVKVLVISDETRETKNGVTFRGIDAIDEIVSGKLTLGKDFDIVITTPKHMKDIAKAAKILGPKGVMPNPKAGTVTNDIDKTVSDLAKGQVEIKNQAGHSVLHTVVGNMNFKDEEIAENITFILSELAKNQPAKLKKKFMQSAYVATSMSPSLKLSVQ